MQGREFDIIIPVFLNPQKYVDSVKIHLEGVDSPQLRILALQYTDEDRFDGAFPMPTDSDGKLVSVVYDRAYLQEYLRTNEIMDVPCVVIAQGTGLKSVVIQLQANPDIAIDSVLDAPKAFVDALEAFDSFSLSKACELFTQVIEAGDGGSRHVAGSLFNIASITQMIDYPTLAVRYISRHITKEAKQNESQDQGQGKEDMVAHTFLWNLTQGAAEGAQEGKDADIHLLECCVRCYVWLCDNNVKDVTSQHRLNTLGRPYLPAGVTQTSQSKAKALNAYARRIYEDMGDKFEGRLLDQLGYRGPWVLYDMVVGLASEGERVGERRLPAETGKWNILDVGSGSGLVGKVFSTFIRSELKTAHLEKDVAEAEPKHTATDIDPTFCSVYEDTAPLQVARDRLIDNARGSAGAETSRGMLAGVDISSKMCDITAASGHYDYVACCDAVEAVQTFVMTPEDTGLPVVRLLDMVVSADTFIYMGALGSFIGACKAALKQGGLLIFSIEDLEQSSMRLDKIGKNSYSTVLPDDRAFILVDDDIPGAVPGWGGALLTSSRYAHSPKYISVLAQLHGFHVRAEEDVVLRIECTAQVKGRMYVLSLA